MAIMQSYWCWRDVYRGSFACAIHTCIYFSVIIISSAKTLINESQYLFGNRSIPESQTNLESGNISPTTIRFNITLLVCAISGFICCIILFYGLMKNQRMCLLPWIIQMIIFMLVDVLYVLYLIFFSNKSEFHPRSALVYTYDLFLLCLHIYAVLCVISQFQEYTPDRTTGADDNERRGPENELISTTSSAFSSRKTTTTTTNNDTKTTGMATPSQSSTAMLSTTASEKSPVGRCSRKHVQFPD